MKNIIKTVALSMLALVALDSCKKVSPKKLEGDWKVVKGTFESSNKNGDYSYTSNTTFNGTKETGSSTSQACSACSTFTNTVDNDVTISYTFNKKSQTFTRTTTKTSRTTTKNFYVYVSNATSGTGFSALAGDPCDKLTIDVATFTEDGIFQITGGSGDIDKNSQIILRVTSDKMVSNKTFSYFQGTTSVDPSGKYEYKDSSGGKLNYISLKTAESSTESNTGKTSTGEVWTVEELKRKTMKLTVANENVNVAGATTTTTKSSGSMELEQQ